MIFKRILNRKYLIIFFLLLSTMLQSQANEPVFSKKSSWTQIITNLMDSTFLKIMNYKIDGDTLIGNKIYSKLLINNGFFSALRETDDNKIYVYFPEISPYTDGELMIYDFDWYPNKILYSETWEGDTIIQTILGSSIDSIQLLNGRYYQCVNNQGKVCLIRGIGNILGFFFFNFSCA